MKSDIVKIAKRALETEIFATAIYGHLAASYPEKATRNTFHEMLDMEKRSAVTCCPKEWVVCCGKAMEKIG